MKKNMKQIKQETQHILKADLSNLEDKLFTEKINKLTDKFLADRFLPDKFLNSKALNKQAANFPEKRRLSYQIINFLVHESMAEQEAIRALNVLRVDYNLRFASANTNIEKKALILQFAVDLGASASRIKGDKRAFKRWFGYDVVLERCSRKIARIEYHLVFLLNRLGVIASKALGSVSDKAEQERILNRINIEKTLKPLLAFSGDERVKIETFRCMTRIIRAIPSQVKNEIIEEEIINFIYRASLDVRQQIWIQCEAFDLLSVLDPDSFFQAATRRLFNPVDGDDLFVRRKIIQLFHDHFNNEKEIKKFIPTISRDISPFVRQAVPGVLIKFLIRQTSGTQNEDIVSWLRHILLKDFSPKVRAAGLLAVASSDDLILLFTGTVSDLIFDHLSMEKDPFAVRVSFKCVYDIINTLNTAGHHDGAAAFFERQLPVITQLHKTAKSLSVRRWAALTREKLLIQTDDEAKDLMEKLAAIIPHIRPGKKKRLPKSWFKNMDDNSIGRILCVLALEDFSLGLEKGITGIFLFRGERFGFRVWRFLHEFFSPSPDKRQGFSHITGRKYFGHLRAPSGIGSELTRTKVPGEPLYVDTESGWRPYLPLVDDAVGCSKTVFSTRPVKIYTPEGVTKMYSPRSLFRRALAWISLTLGFSKHADFRNWEETSRENPDNYIRSLRKLGFDIQFEGFAVIPPQKDEDPSVTRFFAFGLPFFTPDVWTRFKYYFFSAYENSLYELGLFSAALLFFFLYKNLSLSHAVASARKQITLVIGGWGTRGKSGVERLKAAVFEALGHGLVNKTTGCEAMFLHAFPFGKTREMFLFRPYDKATIWEHHHMIRMTQKLKSKIFLWECMALSPAFVKILQQQWTRDDVSTITNTYPDHEDIQGPAGINIPQVMTNFIPKKGVLITSEEEMKPILARDAQEKKTKIEYTGWLESGLLTPDVLGRFTYEEHPSNVALVLKLAGFLDIDPDFALREMADRVIPDIGALKVFPVAPIKNKKLAFINGMSANERFATLSNWKRMKLDSPDYENTPETIISTLVNNRADRITRSRMFASIIVEDLSADYHFLIGSNLSGLMGFITAAWDEYLEKINLFPTETNDRNAGLSTFRQVAVKLRIALSSQTVINRAKVMLNSLGAKLSQEEIKTAVTHPASLLENTTLKNLELKNRAKKTEQIIHHIEKLKKQNKEAEAFQEKIKQQPSTKALEMEFKTLVTRWFKQKLIVIENVHATGEQIINTICSHTPPGLLNRVMGLQNIKGPGLDFVYRWQAWEQCYLAGQNLLNDREPEVFEQGLNMLTSFQDYGMLCRDYLINILDQTAGKGIAQTEKYQAGIALIRSNLDTAVTAIKNNLTVAGSENSIASKITGMVEAVLDAGDAVKRRKIADRIYKDLINERISHERAAIELKKLNQRQKGGWLAG
ncbi:hypothetical protein [Desulfobacula toluolica]|uniref:Conserved uncharacterized protein, related to CapB n=1 Tax=Desulfobacula toluolica (strain DSM 7467 / Tol2) TaxID=651182 RepID=K0NNP3_DESTT|nr:hypothetical protein [Desulfobacula toluolica]CCK82285.1 conserved uncharacterized protein, related to CapB [Desulfobacula toluolica Tol2]